MIDMHVVIMCTSWNITRHWPLPLWVAFPPKLYASIILYKLHIRFTLRLKLALSVPTELLALQVDCAALFCPNVVYCFKTELPYSWSETFRLSLHFAEYILWCVYLQRWHSVQSLKRCCLTCYSCCSYTAQHLSLQHCRAVEWTAHMSLHPQSIVSRRWWCESHWSADCHLWSRWYQGPVYHSPHMQTILCSQHLLWYCRK